MTTRIEKYQFSSVNSGVYNLIASKDSLICFHDSITVGEEACYSGKDTLRNAGSITGRIALDASDDPRTVMIMVIGTNIFTVPSNINGNFTIQKMGQGEYTIRFLSTLDSYFPKDTVVQITAGYHDTLSNPIHLPFRGIPSVTGVSVAWDSLLLQATVHWALLDTSLVSGYKVYRGMVGKSLSSIPLNQLVITDSSFVDTTCAADSSYYYLVAAVNRSGIQGNYSTADTIKGNGGYKLLKVLNDISLSTSWTQFAVRDAKLYWMKGNTIEIHDTTGVLLKKIEFTPTTASNGLSGPKVYRGWFFYSRSF